jgi:hypothetical protein
MAAEKDRLTNAIIALALGAVFLLSREWVGLMIGSLQTWLGDMFRGPRRPGGDILELLLELIVRIVLGLISLVIYAFLWVLNVLNDIYVLPVIVALVAYATPWPVRLRFLNPKPYILRGSRWFWDMLVLSTYGEYIRRGKGKKNLAFIILPLVGSVALLVGGWGLWGGSFRLSGSKILPDGFPSIMPRERTLYLAQRVSTVKNLLHIQKVILSRESTKLVLRWLILAPERTKIVFSPWAGFSASTYLVDDRGNRYALVGSEGMEIGRRYQLVLEEETYSTLIFEPLREEAEYFDLHLFHLGSGEDWQAKNVKVR